MAQLQGEISFAQLAGGGAARPQQPAAAVMRTPPRRRPAAQVPPNTAPARVAGGAGIAAAAGRLDSVNSTPVRDARYVRRSPMSADRFVPTRNAMDFDLCVPRLPPAARRLPPAARCPLPAACFCCCWLRPSAPCAHCRGTPLRGARPTKEANTV